MKSVVSSMKLLLQSKEATPEWFKNKTNIGPSTEPCDTPRSIIQQNCSFDRICYPDSTINCKSADEEICITEWRRLDKIFSTRKLQLF